MCNEPRAAAGSAGPLPHPTVWGSQAWWGILGWHLYSWYARDGKRDWSWASETILTQGSSSSLRLCLAVGAQAAGQAGAVLGGCRVSAWAPAAAGRGGGQPVPQPALPPSSKGPSLGSLTGCASPLGG